MRVEIKGFKMYPIGSSAFAARRDGGHWHVLVDGIDVYTYPNKRVAHTQLEPGRHVLRARSSTTRSTGR